jgi:prepilin-type N-terminal cleavage/methylation domain-containing protein
MRQRILTPVDNESGFTLTELIIVIVVMGLLAALVLAGFNTASKRARDAKRRADIAAIRKGMLGYAINTGSALIPGAGHVGGGQDGLGWFNYQGAPDYTGLSLDQALQNAGLISTGTADPLQGEKGYMIYPCAGPDLLGVFATLETPTARDLATKNTWTNQGCTSDPFDTYGKNYVLVVPLYN